MLLYFILAFLIYIFSIYDISIERNNIISNRIFSLSIYYLLIFTLIILGGIRWLTGSDWIPYYNYFINNKTLADYTVRFEPLYALLNFLIHFFTNSYTIFLCIFSLLVIYIKVKTIKKIALYPALSFYLFYCTNIGDIFAVRQSLSLSILLVSIYFIHKRDKKLFLILLIFATLVHYSSIFWIFSYYVYHKKINTTYIGIIVIASIIFGFFGGILYPIIINTIFKPFSFLNTISKILFYSSRVDFGFSYQKVIVSIIKRVIFIPMFLIFRNRLIKIDKYISGILNLYIFGNIIYLLFSISATTFQRMTTPYVFTEIFILPVFLKIIRINNYKYILLFILFLYGLFKLYSAILPFASVLIPYYSIFNYENRIM
jgi:hypothetical protein